MAKVSKSPSIEALRADVLKAWMMSVLSISFNHSLHPPKGTILKRAHCFYHVAPTVANLSDVERGALWVSWGPDQNCPRKTVKLLGVSQAPPQVVSDDACDSVSMLRLGGKLEVFRGNGPMTSFELAAPCLAQDFSKRFQKGRLYGLSTTHALTRPSLRPRIGEAVNFF